MCMCCRPQVEGGRLLPQDKVAQYAHVGIVSVPLAAISGNRLAVVARGLGAPRSKLLCRLAGQYMELAVDRLTPAGPVGGDMLADAGCARGPRATGAQERSRRACIDAYVRAQDT